MFASLMKAPPEFLQSYCFLKNIQNRTSRFIVFSTGTNPNRYLRQCPPFKMSLFKVTLWICSDFCGAMAVLFVWKRIWSSLMSDVRIWSRCWILVTPKWLSWLIRWWLSSIRASEWSSWWITLKSIWIGEAKSNIVHSSKNYKRIYY